MIEPIMYFGIGFLVAALIGLVVIPLVHGRAVRLTMRRLEAATPLSMAEIQADKDQLRAEFAMSTRRLEMSVEQLKTKTTSQLAELGKKSDAINRLKIELGEKTATIFALEARDKALRDQLRATEEEVAAKTGIMHEAERTLVRQGSRARQADRRARRALDAGRLPEGRDRRAQDPGRGAERAAHRRRQRAQGGGRPPRRRAGRAESRDPGTGRRARPGRESRPPRRRARTAIWWRRPREAELLGRRAQDLESRLGEQARLLAESEFELNQTAQRIADRAQEPKAICAPPSPSSTSRTTAGDRDSSRRKRRSCSPTSAAPSTSATGWRATSAA